MADRFEYYITGEDGDVTINGSAKRQAQTFTPAVGHTITSIKLKLTKAASPGTVYAGITGGVPSGSVLAQGSTNGNTLPNYPTGEWREFTLDTPLELAAETQYAIVFWGPSTDGTNKAYPRCDATASAYPGGYIWGSTDGGASWPNSSPTWDFMFEEWGTADVIPKTSSDSGSGSEVLRSRDLGAAQTGAGTDMARNYSGQKGVAFSIIDLTTFCTPMSWASIDLSAYLPANTTMAFLRVTGGGCCS